MQFTVNGEQVGVDADADASLATVLREQLGLTALKVACGRGECGACTVLIDGRPRMSCITLAALAGDVVTLEGLADESAELRAEFAERGAFQCGFCTPGQVVHAVAVLRDELPAAPDERRAVIRRRMTGNICRCTGYQAIIDSVCAVADRNGDEGDAA